MSKLITMKFNSMNNQESEATAPVKADEADAGIMSNNRDES